MRNRVRIIPVLHPVLHLENRNIPLRGVRVTPCFKAGLGYSMQKEENVAQRGIPDVSARKGELHRDYRRVEVSKYPRISGNNC